MYFKWKISYGCLTLVIDSFLSCVVSGHSSEKTLELVALVGASSPGLTGITVDKSVEFSYEELAKATSDFNIANKIGQGGFGAVYYAELRGEVCVLASMFHPQSFL